ncbi:MAG: DarT ssDNA thymidine ADP-ribosyltransferase family protein [Thermoguttaceae bacterium]|jgi:hypothetical protein
MATVPARPKIYHITHLRNLPQIVAAGRIWSDAKRKYAEAEKAEGFVFLHHK